MLLSRTPSTAAMIYIIIIPRVSLLEDLILEVYDYKIEYLLRALSYIQDILADILTIQSH
jgi:hypothetical protein